MHQVAEITYWIAFTAGILSFASPCVLPLIPSYLTYITGLSFSQLEDAHPGAKIRLTVLLHSLCFILGFSVVFVLLGAIAGIASSKFQLYLREGLEWPDVGHITSMARALAEEERFADWVRFNRVVKSA